MDIKKHFPLISIFLLYALIGTSMYSFVGVELTDDVKVFIGAGKQAILDVPSVGMLHAVDDSWELKPIANRMIYYLVAAWSKIIGLEEGLNLKIMALLLLWVILMGFCYYASGKFPNPSPIDSDMVAGFAFIGMLTLANIYFLQAEWWAVVFSFLVLWFLLTERPTLQGLAGILSVVIIFLKLSTILLIPTILVAYVMIKGLPNRDDIIAYGGGIAGGTCFALAWILYLPHMLPDMLLSVQLAHAAKGVDIPPVPDGVNYLVHYLFVNVWNAPIIGVGIVAALAIITIRIVSIRNFPEKRDENLDAISILVALWVFPLASILIQKEFFSYHYAIMIFPAIITIIGLLRHFLLKERLYIVISIVITIFVIWFMCNSLWSGSYSSQDAFWNRTMTDNATFNEKYDLSGQILYLDIPSATYYLDAKSACRMVGSLPIERKLIQTREYSENMECIRGYQGKYVIAKHGSGMPALLPNYTRIEEGNAWDIYSRT